MMAEIGEIVEHVSKLDGKTKVPWVYLGSGRWRRVSDMVEENSRIGPACHDVNYFQDGTFRYNTHGRSDKGAQPCIEDLGNDEARKHWHNYVVTTDAQGNRVEGPAPFTSNAEKRRYYQLFGYEEGERGYRQPHPREQVRRRLEAKWRRRGR
jgi:hypothetical protein